MKHDDLEIEGVGALGDGFATSDGERIFVPGALPGETWRRIGNDDFECVAQSPARQVPACPHFGTCGGCLTQHMGDGVYRDWKLAIVKQAFHQHGIDIPPLDLHVVQPASRRRCMLTLERASGRVSLGYHRLRSHDLIDIEACPVLAPQIVQALPALRELGETLAPPQRQELRLTVLLADQGLDIDFDGQGLKTGPQHRADLAALADKHGFVRLSDRGDAVVMRAQPTVTVAGVSVPVPDAGVFLQAVPEAEQRMSELVVKASGSAKRALDLFCGAGTIAFALARKSRVLAVDSEKGAITALTAGRDSAQNLKPIETLVRDLFREPLSRKELEPFDCVVFDPPRAGAEAQAKMLARSIVPKVVAVSCNPGTLARDARILVDGGYELKALTAIDQFLYSAHVECVAVFERPGKRRVRR